VCGDLARHLSTGCDYGAQTTTSIARASRGAELEQI
jgi:hypothetical protein